MRTYQTERPRRQQPLWVDALVLVVLLSLLAAILRLALTSPPPAPSPPVSLSLSALGSYALLSTGRMAAAYLLSLLFTLSYGTLAASGRRAERVMIPLLDVLQSVPLLSFLPAAMLGFGLFLPERIAVEAASIVLIFTSQAWNLTFSWYQSLTTVPVELQQASVIFRFNRWLRFRLLWLPFAAIGLIWNSVLSWANGWFFLIAAEIFTLGQRSFRLPGLGSYLQQAASEGNLGALALGLAVLAGVIILFDQLLWQPLLSWARRFEQGAETAGRPVPSSWWYEVLARSRLLAATLRPLGAWVLAKLDAWAIRRFPWRPERPRRSAGRSWSRYLARAVAGGGLLGGGLVVWRFVSPLDARAWAEVGLGLLATLGRVAAALLLALLWTVPAGVAIATRVRLARWLQPVVQIAASIPATALFPVLVLALVRLPRGLDLAAVVLMLAGAQWYLLFNVIAGASTIPRQLEQATALLGLSRTQRWRRLVLPALMPFLVTGSITASGGAWNASIIAEYLSLGGQTLQVRGLGSLIARATASGDYRLLLAATAAMVLAVVTINRLCWRRLQLLVEERYRLG